MTPRAAPRVHARRQLATVLIDGASPVGLRVAEHLARSGLGTLLLRDAAPVGAADLRQAAGALGFRALHQGRRREDAAVEELKLVGADAAVLAAPEDFGTAGVDLHIALGDSLEKLLGRVRPAVEEGQGALPVVIGGREWRIGPLLTREGGVCPDCLLAEAAPSEDPHGGLDEADASLVAAAVAQQALRLVDGSTAAAVEQHTLWGGLESGRLGCSEAEAADRCDCLFARL